jgi:hypothetical protein
MKIGLIRIMTVFVVYSCISAFFVHYAFSQSSPARHYTSDDGLSSNTVYDIEQDHRGFVWFATSAGVCRFDGNAFVRLTLEDGLSDNEVLKIRKDSQNRLWLLGFNASVSVIEGDIVHNGFSHPLLKKLAANFFYISMYEGPDGSVYISNKRTMHARIRFPLTIDSLNPESEIIFSTTKGLVDRMGKLDFLLAESNEKIDLSAREKPVRSWCAYKDSLLFVNTEYGVIQIDKNHQATILDIPKEYLKSNLEMYCDNDLGLWLTAYNSGVAYFPRNANGYTYYKTFFRTENVTSVFRDNERNVWFSTHGNGVFMMPGNFGSVISYTTADGLAESEAYSILVDSSERIWMGQKNGVVEVIDGNKIHQFQLHEDMNSMARIMALTETSMGVFAGADAGLFLLKLDSLGALFNHRYAFSFLSRNNAISKIAAIKDLELSTANALYIVSIEGTHKLDLVPDFKAETVISEISLPRKRYYAVCPVDSSSFWFSDSEGLSIFRNGKIISYAGNHPLLSKRIVELVRFEKLLLASVEGYGLVVLKPDGSAFNLATQQGLLSNHCGRVFVKEEIAYVCTNKGISVLSISDDSLIVSGKITTADGLLSNQVNDVFVRGRKLYAASQRGVSVLKIDKQFGLSANKPSIFLMSVTWQGEDILNRKDPALGFGKGNLRFQFISPLFSIPEGVSYQYRLNDQDWIDIPSNTFEFNSLQPGNYTFMARARHLDSPWSEHVSYSFAVPQPFYSAWWFYMSLLLVISGITALIYYRYAMRLKSEQLIKFEYDQQINRLQNQSLQAMMNPHFIFNSLSAIQQLISSGQTSEARNYLSRFARLLRMNLQTIREDFIPLREELERIHLYLETEKLRLGDKLDYKIEVDDTISPDDELIPSMIIQPFVENSIWHGIMPREIGGRVSIRMKADVESITIEIDDNGIGIEASARKNKEMPGHTPIGILLTRQRLEFLQNKSGKRVTLTVRDKAGIPEQGTLVTIILPLFSIED